MHCLLKVLKPVIRIRIRDPDPEITHRKGKQVLDVLLGRAQACPVA
jgi:hypothetical protein